MAEDRVNHPNHYTSHPSGVECIQVTEHFNFNIGNAIKYLWRSGLKGFTLEDLHKARWYVTREIERLEKDLEDAQQRSIAPRKPKLSKEEIVKRGHEERLDKLREAEELLNTPIKVADYPELNAGPPTELTERQGEAYSDFRLRTEIQKSEAKPCSTYLVPDCYCALHPEANKVYTDRISEISKAHLAKLRRIDDARIKENSSQPAVLPQSTEDYPYSED